jgi:antitoxin component YwqK of YwqJK toxin-antitoxin module
VPRQWGALGERTRHYAWVAASPTDGLYSFIYNRMQYTGRYKDGLRDGAWRVLRDDGSDAWEVTWKSGEWNGPSVTWWKTGAKQDEGLHDSGKRTGVWRFWFDNGEPAAEGEYRDDPRSANGGIGIRVGRQ